MPNRRDVVRQGALWVLGAATVPYTRKYWPVGISLKQPVFNTPSDEWTRHYFDSNYPIPRNGFPRPLLEYAYDPITKTRRLIDVYD